LKAEQTRRAATANLAANRETAIRESTAEYKALIAETAELRALIYRIAEDMQTLNLLLKNRDERKYQADKRIEDHAGAYHAAANPADNTGLVLTSPYQLYRSDITAAGGDNPALTTILDSAAPAWAEHVLDLTSFDPTTGLRRMTRRR
jgi:hypothetical protein